MSRLAVFAFALVVLSSCTPDSSDEAEAAEAGDGDGDPTGDGDPAGACCYCRGYGADAISGDPANGDNIRDGSWECVDYGVGEELCLAKMDTEFGEQFGHIWGYDSDCPEAATADRYDDAACDMSCPMIDPGPQEVWCTNNQVCQPIFGGCGETTENPCVDGYQGPVACVFPDSGTCLPEVDGDCGLGGAVDACTLNPADYLE